MPSPNSPANFTIDGARQVVDVVRRVQALEINVKTLQRNITRRLAPILPTIAFTQTVLAPNATGEVILGFGVPGMEAELPAGNLINATNSTGSTVWAGSMVIMAWLMVEQSEGSGWHIIQSNSARTVKATVNEGSGVLTSDALYDVDSVTAQSGSYFDAVTITDVRNTHAWAMDNNAIVQLIYNETSGEWDTVQVTCPA